MLVWPMTNIKRKLERVRRSLKEQEVRLPEPEEVKADLGVFSYSGYLPELERLAEGEYGKAGFDLTDYGPARDFREVLQSVGLDPDDWLVEYRENLDGERERSGFQWRGSSIILATYNNPITGEYAIPNRREDERGYASYMAVEGSPQAVAKFTFETLRNAEYIKEIEFGEHGFTSIGQDVERPE